MSCIIFKKVAKNIKFVAAIEDLDPKLNDPLLLHDKVNYITLINYTSLEKYFSQLDLRVGDDDSHSYHIIYTITIEIVNVILIKEIFGNVLYRWRMFY